MQKKKKRKKKNIYKMLILTMIICIIVLVIEFIYIGYTYRDQPIYFDGINALISTNKGYVTVGSNNNNESYLEKAKITKYNSKKEKVFEKIYNKGLNGVFFDIVEDIDGNLIAVGSYESSDKDHLEGNRVGLIVKYDKDGNLVYENSYSILDDSKFTSVYSYEDYYFVTGQSVYSDMKVGVSTAGGALLLCYDKELNLIWSKNYGDNKTSSYNDLVIYDEHIYAVGSNNSTSSVITKYDLNGKLINSVIYDDTDSLGFTGVINKGRYLIVSGSKHEKDSDNYDALIVRYNKNLEFREEVIYEGDFSERYNQLILDKNENVVVVGTSRRLDDNEENVNVYIHDGIIGKYDKDLKKVTVVSYGDDRDDYLTDIIEDGNSYLVVGYSSYEDGSYLSKFITYSDALKALGVE